MSETQEITQKTVGFSFHITIEKEKRVETGAKYPDKLITKASLGGHTETFGEAVQTLKRATLEVLQVLQAKATEPTK